MIFSRKKTRPEFPTTIEINKIEFKIEVIISKKRSSSANIKERKIIFRLSEYLNNKELEKHFNSLLKRIIKKISTTNITLKSFKEILEKRELNFANTKYKLEFTKNRGIKLKENTFYINYKTKILTIEKTIIKILIEIYTKRIENYVKELNKETYNYNIKEVTLKNVGSKWGHCTHDNRIMLNLKLLNTTKEILDYVIIHEISHIKEKNHSVKFWNEVKRFSPNYKIIKNKLKKNPPPLFN